MEVCASRVSFTKYFNRGSIGCTRGEKVTRERKHHELDLVDLGVGVGVYLVDLAGG